MTGFEVGAAVTGTVSAIPRPGAIGLFVELDGERQGFVDVLILPRRPESWPAVGTKTTFEVLAGRSGQVRLWPLDPEFRSGPLDNGVSDEQWRARKARHPVGTVLTAEVSDVYVGSYLVRYEGGWSLLEDDEALPEVGTRAAYEVIRHLDTTRRTLLRPST
ncbi:hypothetical protein AB0F52_06540 [Amycolatopsis sp. NPDC024027]|uniref:hypothetical protein n=1 Tax=Amycolatopsis sp. NPDC024027 TaxID=3154327 RepID=UPI0033D9D2E7